MDPLMNKYLEKYVFHLQTCITKYAKQGNFLADSMFFSLLLIKANNFLKKYNCFIQCSLHMFLAVPISCFAIVTAQPQLDLGVT